MANVYRKKKYINYPDVEVRLSKDLEGMYDPKHLEIFVKQIRKLPKEVPVLEFVQTNEALASQDRIAKIRDLSMLAAVSKKCQIFVAYKKDETYSMGNSVGKVFSTVTTGAGETSAGLITLNSKRIKEAYADNAHFIANTIFHEILHVYGLDHSIGMPEKVKNRPVMQLGKMLPIGLSFDDRCGLKEIYQTPKKKLVCVTVNADGKYVALLNKDKPNKSQSKSLYQGSATFPYTPKGKYDVIIDGVKIKTVTIKKDVSL